MMNKRGNTIAAAAMAFSMSAVWAQDPAAPPAEKAGEMEAMPGMDHGDGQGSKSAAEDKMPKAAPMNSGDAASRKADGMSNMNHGESGMDHGTMSMQGGKAPPDARDPHA